jgi:hypothetical protein
MPPDLGRRTAALLIHLTIFASAASAQLRIAEWNVTNYSSGRVADFQVSLYGDFEGRQMAPDVLIGQEFLSDAGVNNFLALLNAASGSPGDWAAAPFVDGPDTDNAFFYRTSKVDFLGSIVVAVGGLSPNHPRNVNRYDIRPRGYAAATTVIACYSSHMKSGTATDDQNRRLLEATRIRANAEALPVGWNFLLGGDFNIQSSAQAAYVKLVGSETNDAGRFFDPINTPGNWNNNPAFRIVHTQDPAGPGGMDDRHDQILVSYSLIDGDGLDYIGNPTIPYSTTTWNDPNHSYRSWGNDGTSFDQSLKIAGNQMVGAAIAQALFNAASGQGHLPVYLDLRLPARLAAPDLIDFGTVSQYQTADQPIEIINSADVALWTADGLDALRYTLSTTAGFSTPAGPFADPAGGTGITHVVSMDTSAPGPVSGTLTIASNAPDQSVKLVMLLGEVVSTCDPADVNCDNTVDLLDVEDFVASLLAGIAPCSPCAANVNADDEINGADIAPFVRRLAP